MATEERFNYITLQFGLQGKIALLDVWIGLVMQVFNEVNCREMEEVDVFKGIWDNHVFIAVLSATVFFQILIVEYLGTFANTTPLSLVQWIFCLGAGYVGLPLAVRLKQIPV